MSVGSQLALAVVNAAAMLGGAWALLNPSPGQPHYRITATRDVILGVAGLLFAFLPR